MLILGLDLGVTSIGWAITEQRQSSIADLSQVTLLDWGSRIFEPGMDGDIESGKGESLAVQRRLKRSLRVQYRRRRKRKRDLIEIMTEAGFLPVELTPSFFVEMDTKLLRLFPKEEWGRLGHVIPYLYRKMALDKDLSAMELGRTLYHLAQRRGYKSNRKKTAKKDDEKGKVLSGIQTLKAQMAASNARTLGDYFCTLNPEVVRIRGNYTDRSMYEHEFRLICERQRKLISPELEKKLYKAIFYQRPLKSVKGLIGACVYEPDEKRCSFRCEEAQLYRLYTSVENLTIRKDGNSRKLTDEERSAALSVLNGYSENLELSGKITLKNLKKELKLQKGEEFTLGDDEKNIYGNALHAMLFHVFGENSANMTCEEQGRFWHDINSIEKEATLKKRLEGYWKLDDEHVRRAMELNLPDEYCSLSLKALRKILPDLEAGIPIRKIIELQYPEKCRPIGNERELLPAVDDTNMQLRNPVVHRTLTELRKVVNAIIQRYGKPDYIRIELARDLKNSNKERERIKEENSKREKERERIARKIIDETAITNPRKKDILKVMLAEECGFECPYTGQAISMSDLFDDNIVQIEHIIPFSRSYDDSFKNKTLCMARENGRKSNKTPYEAYSKEDYERILERVKRFKGDYAEKKLAVFETKEFSPDDFLARNLNDTRYASRLAMQYLGLLYGGVVDKNGKRRIQACSGGCTALMRHSWGANYLLGDGEKSRDDHRHHAVDALTIAIITPDIVKMAASISKDEHKYRKEQKLPDLGGALLEQAREKLSVATVSHHIQNRIRGALHDETIYSSDGKVTYKRTALSSLSKNDVPLIRDKAIRKAVYGAMGLQDGDEVTANHLKVFKDEKNYPALRDAKGNVVNTIKAVKVACAQSTITIGTGDGVRNIKPNNNYLAVIYSETTGTKIKWVLECLTMLEACKRKQQHKPLVDKGTQGRSFVCTLKKGDIVVVNKDGQEERCLVRAFSESDQRISLVPITDARDKKQLLEAQKYYRLTPGALQKCNMKKVQMSIFGELRRAND